MTAMSRIDHLVYGTSDLERTVNEAGKQELIKAKQDQFLEIYSEWRKNPSPETEQKLKRAAEEIQELNPNFSFTLPGQKRKGTTVVTGTGDPAEAPTTTPAKHSGPIIEAPEPKPRAKGSSTHLAEPESDEEE